MKTSTLSLTTLSATELASLIASGDVSSVEAVEAHIARIEKVNPALNAVVFKHYEAARAEARQADEKRVRKEPLGPLHGVPLTVKESLDLRDSPSTFGLPSRAGSRATEDDIYVARLRRAGGIILGKTNASQVLFFVETDNPLYGRTNNPWNLERSPGGSSGGQAAIIAAGGSPWDWRPTSAAVSGFRPLLAALPGSNPRQAAPPMPGGTVRPSASRRLSAR